MKKSTPQLHQNEAYTRFVEQNFPVQKMPSGNVSIKCVSCQGKDTHKHLFCDCFRVEVVKDYEGEVSYILIGVGWNPQRNNSEHIYIMRTTDFNKAYDLKMKLDELCGTAVSKYQKMPCYGTLQRAQLPFDKDEVK